MKKGVYIFWAVFIVIAGIRLFSSFHIEVPDLDKCVSKNIFGTAVITNEPEIKETGQVFIIDVKDAYSESSLSELCATNVRLRIKTKLYPRFSYGDSIGFSGKLSKPFNFSSGNGRSFDYKGYLAKDEVYYEIKSAEVTLDADNSSEGSFAGYLKSTLLHIKKSFVGNLTKSLGDPHAALAAGLVVGEKSALGKELLDDFRVVGLIHIIVLSGFNITIVADALRRVLSFLPRVWGIVIGGIGIMLFGILVGGGATVVRSCFMAGVALSADLIRRDYSVVRALLFAGILMIIQNPMIFLHDPSFQLSFLATLGLIILAGPLEKKMTFLPEKFGLRGIVATTLATQIFVSPFILHMMGEISIIGIVVNILVLPLIPITMLSVFITGVSGFISGVFSQTIGWITHILLSYELFMVETFAEVPLASIKVPSFSFWWVVGFYLLFTIIYLLILHLRNLPRSLTN